MSHRNTARYLLFVTSLVALLGTGGCLLGPPGETSGGYTVTGQVLQADGATPLSGTKVHVGLAPAHEVLQKRDLANIFANSWVLTNTEGTFKYRIYHRMSLGQSYVGLPRAKEVFVYVELPDGWHVQKVDVQKQKQEGTAHSRSLTLPPLVMGHEPSLGFFTTGRTGDIQHFR